jgi:signal transduction histidine kinase
MSGSDEVGQRPGALPGAGPGLRREAAHRGRLPAAWRALPEPARDLVVALTVLAGGCLTSVLEIASPLDEQTPGPDGLSLVLVALMTLPLAICRRHPVAAATIGAGAFAVSSFRGYVPGLADLTALVLLGLAAARTDRRTAIALGGAAGLAGLSLGAVEAPPFSIAELALGLAVGVLPVVLGDAFRTQRAYVASIEEQARQLEHLRDLELRRAVAHERMRIARDVHDSVGHHLSAITVQAGAGRQMLDVDVGVSREAFLTISTLGSRALAELRELLGLIREGEAQEAVLCRDRLDLEALTAAASSYGLGLDLATDGLGQPLPTGVETCAQRILQEAVANVSRHSAATSAQVRLARRDDALELLVHDPGPAVAGPAASSCGYGLRGMQERASLAGGRLQAGPDGDGGWLVRARLPLRPGKGLA